MLFGDAVGDEEEMSDRVNNQYKQQILAYRIFLVYRKRVPKNWGNF